MDILVKPDTLKALLEKDLRIPMDELQSMRATVLSETLLKKYVAPGGNDLLDRQAKENFLNWNDLVQNKAICSNWSEDPRMRFWRDEVHHAFRDDASNGPLALSYGKFLSYGACGPGSSLGSRSNDFLTKMFDSTLTHTSPFLLRFYRSYVTGKWSEAEEIRALNHPTVQVQGSRLSTVPKDSKKNRTICTEPTLNMFYQLGAKRCLELILERDFSIHMDIQPEVNKALARFASIDGSFSTIDLRNASDSLSIELMRFLLPKNVFQILDMIRCDSTFVNGKYVKLNMISTMGNGFTFPLMTLIFSCLLRAVYRMNGGPFQNLYYVQSGRVFLSKRTDFGVFGDDLIVRTEYTPEVLELLEVSGFVVNSDKSFTTGFFRESCGGDFYRGHNVRGVYLKEFNDEADIYTALNRLCSWSCRFGIPLENVSRYLVQFCKIRPVPLYSNINEGILLPSDLLLSPKSDGNGALFYRALRPIKRGWRVGDSYTNPVGAEISAIGGYVRDNFINARPWRVKYKVVKLKSPCWDFTSDPDVLHRDRVMFWTRVLTRA